MTQHSLSWSFLGLVTPSLGSALVSVNTVLTSQLVYGKVK